MTGHAKWGAFALGLLAALALGCSNGDPDPEPAPCVEKSGLACVWAGKTGELGFDGDGKLRTKTLLYWPMDLSFGPDGTPWLLDWNNHKIRRVLDDDTVETVVGDFLGDGAADGSDAKEPGAPGDEVNLNHPTDIVFKKDGTLVFAAWHNHKIRKVDPTTGRVVILYGKGPGLAGDGGQVADVRFNQPSRLALDKSDALYIVDQRNFRVRRIASDNAVIESFAGTTKGFSGDDGPANLAQLEFEAGSNPEPSGAIAIGEDDSVYVADTVNHRIRKIDKDGIISTVAGDGTSGFKGDGQTADLARFANIKDMEFGPDGRLYLADTDNNRIRAIDLNGDRKVETVAGNGDYHGGPADGLDPKTISLARPFGIAFDADGALYIADTHNSRIIKVPR